MLCIIMDKGNPTVVLCIDDETLGLKVRKMVLERAGYAVLTAENGQLGLDLFASNPVQIVVLDYAMPGMNGGEVAARMRAAKPEVPILMLSAYVDLDPEVTSLVDFYLTKGSGAAALLDSIRVLLAGGHPSKDAEDPQAGPQAGRAGVD